MADSSNKGAEQIVLGINVTGTEQVQQATTEVGKLGAKIDETGKKDLGTAQFKNYKQLIREATQELQKVEQQSGKNSTAFLTGAKNLAELKRRAQEFNDTIKAFSPEDKFKSFAKIAQGLTGTLAGVSGGMVALGFESDKSAQVMAKLQGLLLFSNALNHLDDIKQGFLDFGRVIKSVFLIKQTDTVATEAQTAATVAATAANEAATKAAADLAAAETALAEARVAANELAAEAEAALTEAKLAGLDADAEISGAEEAYLELAAAKATALAELTTLQTAYNAALTGEAEASLAATTASEAQTVATAAVAASEAGATVASITLKLALWSIGIGLLITVVVALVAEWDNVKKGFLSLFPVLKDGKGFFNGFVQDVTGVGFALLKFIKTPLDAVLLSLKLLYDTITGDFKKGAEDLKNGLKDIANDLNVVANFKQGQADKAAQQAEDERKIRVQKEVDANERIIKERKALGQSTTALEISNQKLKNSLLDKDDKDYEKKKLDGESELTVILNAEQKKRADAAEKIRKEASDKAAAQLKSDLDKIIKANEDALKVIAEGSQDARDKELTDVQIKYDKEQALLEKRKNDVADYNAEYLNLVTARKDEEAKINKKYDDQISDYLAGVSAEAISKYDKNIADINKKIDDLLKNATPEEADALEASRENQISSQRGSKIADDADVKAKTKLAKTKGNSKFKLSKKDSPDEAIEKLEALTKAEISAENAAFELKRSQIQGQNEQLELLDADHQNILTAIAKENTDARIDIAQAEKDNQLALYGAIGDAASSLSNVIGQNTIASKALGIASATIDTYVGATKALAQGGIFGYIGAAAIIATGIANVKKITDVKVPAKTGKNSSAGATAAPVINSTVLQQSSNGTKDIVNAVNTNTTTQKEIRAFIVEKDLNKQQAKSNYFNKQSSY